jgi:TolB protein
VQGFTDTTADAAQYLISGSNNGNLMGRATDRFNKSVLVNKSYTEAALRRQAHAFVDDFLKAINRKGISQTKIAFRMDKGANKEIYVADFDGHNAQAITRDNVNVAAPAWAGNKFALYYVSYKFGNRNFLSRFEFEQRRTLLVTLVEHQPMVSPDGARWPHLSKDGGRTIFANADGAIYAIDQIARRRIIAVMVTDGNDRFAAKSRWRPMIAARCPRQEEARIPGGVSNPTEPDWSPDGKWIVFTGRGRFESVSLSKGAATVLVSGDRPSTEFPDGRLLRAATGLSLLDVPTNKQRYFPISEVHNPVGPDSLPNRKEMK